MTRCLIKYEVTDILWLSIKDAIKINMITFRVTLENICSR